MFELVIEMNSRQQTVERRTDTIESTLMSLQVNQLRRVAIVTESTVATMTVFRELSIPPGGGVHSIPKFQYTPPERVPPLWGVNELLKRNAAYVLFI